MTGTVQRAQPADATARHIKRYLWIAAGAWTAITLASLAVTHRLNRQWLHDEAYIQATIALDKDVVYRRWNSGHGGLYAPVSAQTIPDLYLSHIPDRDVTTGSGSTLTIVSHAYMTRQVHELEKSRSGVRGHLTGFRAISPANNPDDWERGALARFEKGAQEESGFADLEGKSYFRLIRAFKTEQSCLRCHEIHGFREGELGGGISVSVPMEPLMALSGKRTSLMYLGHMAALCVGLLGIAFGGRRLLSAEHARGLTQEERTRAAESVKQSAKRWQATFDSIPDIVCVISPQHEFLEINEAGCKALGLHKDQILGKKCYELVHGRNSPIDACPCMAALTGLTPATAEYEERGRVFNLAAWPMRGEGGEVISLTHVVKDTTERKHVEDSLLASEVRYRRLFESARDGIVILDYETGTVVDVNPYLVEKLGHSREYILSKKVWELGFWGDFIASEANFEELRQKEYIRYDDKPLKTADGRKMDVEFVSNVYLVDHKKVIQCNIRDITERKQAGEEHLKLERQLAQSKKLEMVGQLAGGVAHDFNNILSVIISYAGFLLDELPKGSPLAADAMEIKNAGQRAADLTRQLLAFSRKQQVLPRSIDLNESIVGISKMLGRLIGEHIKLKLNLAPGTGRVFMDSSQLESVIINLTVNARDAMQGGGVLTIATSVAEGNLLRMTVADTGTGMTDEVRGHIFEPFFTTKAIGKGSGLGLSTVYGVVTQNGGHIEVESAPGKGSTFTVYLNSHKETAAVETVEMQETRVVRSGSILLVEDEDAVRRGMARTLRGAGYTVTEARNGEEAIEKYRVPDACFSLVITDMIMPGIGGVETARAIYAMNPAQKVIYCSGYTDDMQGRQGVRGAEDVVLTKPVLKEDLLRRIEEIIRAPKAPSL